MPGEMRPMTTMDAGDLRTLMEIYGGDVWNYAYFLSRSRSAADDIAQETFIRAYKHMNTYRREAGVKTWLLRIARNRWLSYRSTAFMRRAALTEQPESGSAQSAEDDYLRRSLTDEVWGIVLELPRKYREALMLAAHYGLTMEEMAQTLGISVSAAKSRLRKARQLAGERWRKERDGR